MDGIIKRLSTGDISAILQSLEEIFLKRFKVTKDLIDVITTIITKHTNTVFVPVEYAEKFLALVGRLMDSGGDASLTLFAQQANFIEGIISLVHNFKIRLVVSPTRLNSKFSFKSHYCYELALFILLGIVEKASLMKAFAKSVNPESLIQLMECTSAIITTDYLYITQEMALEITGRVCHYYNRADRIVYENILKLLPIEITRPMRDPAVGIVNLLRNMRDVLNEINVGNPHIKSLPISRFAVNTTWMPQNQEKSFETNGYLDICKEYICFSIATEDKLIRFPFSSIRRVHFATEIISLQLLLDSCPDKLSDLIPVAERSPTGQCPLMSFFFDKKYDVMMQAKDILELRLAETDEIQLASQRSAKEEAERIAALGTPKFVKASVVSSKMLPPPPPKAVTPVLPTEVMVESSTPAKAKKAPAPATATAAAIAGAVKSPTTLPNVPPQMLSPVVSAPDQRGPAFISPSSAKYSKSSHHPQSDHDTVSSVSSPDMSPPGTVPVEPLSRPPSAGSGVIGKKGGSRAGDEIDPMLEMLEAENVPPPKVVVLHKGRRGAASVALTGPNSPIHFTAPKQPPVAAKGGRGKKGKATTPAKAAVVKPVAAKPSPVIAAPVPKSGSKRKFGSTLKAASQDTAESVPSFDLDFDDEPVHHDAQQEEEPVPVAAAAVQKSPKGKKAAPVVKKVTPASTPAKKTPAAAVAAKTSAKGRGAPTTAAEEAGEEVEEVEPMSLPGEELVSERVTEPEAPEAPEQDTEVVAPASKATKKPSPPSKSKSKANASKDNGKEKENNKEVIEQAPVESIPVAPAAMTTPVSRRKKGGFPEPPRPVFHTSAADKNKDDYDVVTDFLDSFSVGGGASVHTNTTSMSKRKYGQKYTTQFGSPVPVVAVPKMDFTIYYDEDEPAAATKGGNAKKTAFAGKSTAGTSSAQKTPAAAAKDKDKDTFVAPTSTMKKSVPRMRAVSNENAADTTEKVTEEAASIEKPVPATSNSGTKGRMRRPGADGGDNHTVVTEHTTATTKSIKPIADKPAIEPTVEEEEAPAAVSSKPSTRRGASKTSAAPSKDIASKIKTAKPSESTESEPAPVVAPIKGFGAKRKFGTVLSENTLAAQRDSIIAGAALPEASTKGSVFDHTNKENPRGGVPVLSRKDAAVAAAAKAKTAVATDSVETAAKKQKTTARSMGAKAAELESEAVRYDEAEEDAAAYHMGDDFGDGGGGMDDDNWRGQDHGAAADTSADLDHDEEQQKQKEKGKDAGSDSSLSVSEVEPSAPAFTVPLTVSSLFTNPLRDTLSGGAVKSWRDVQSATTVTHEPAAADVMHTEKETEQEPHKRGDATYKIRSAPSHQTATSPAPAAAVAKGPKGRGGGTGSSSSEFVPLQLVSTNKQSSVYSAPNSPVANQYGEHSDAEGDGALSLSQSQSQSQSQHYHSDYSAHAPVVKPKSKHASALTSAATGGRGGGRGKTTSETTTGGNARGGGGGSRKRGRSTHSDVDEDENGEGDDDVYVERDEDNTPISVSENDSQDDDGIIAILLQEIVAMQKARAARKRARLMQTVTTTATTQIGQYLNQVKEFADSSAQSITLPMEAKLTALGTAADSVCEELARDTELCVREYKDIHKLYLALEKEMAAFGTEMNGLVTQYAKEEKSVKNEIYALRKSSLDVVKKTIAVRYEERGSSSGTAEGKKMQLLKALRNI